MKVKVHKEDVQQTLENSDIKKLENLAKVFVESALQSGLNQTEIDKIYEEVRERKVKYSEKQKLLIQIEKESADEKSFREKVDKFLDGIYYLLEDQELLEYKEQFRAEQWGPYDGELIHKPETYNLPQWERLYYKYKSENGYLLYSPVTISKTFCREILCAIYKNFKEQEHLNTCCIFDQAKNRLRHSLYDYVYSTWINYYKVLDMFEIVLSPILEEYEGNSDLYEFLEEIEYFESELPFIIIVWIIQNI